jgi:hypothetical protein
MSKQKDRFIDFGVNESQVNAGDLPCMFTPSNYTPANNTVEEHLKSLDAELSNRIKQSFETVSKDLRAFPCVLNSDGDVLTSIVYDLGGGQSVTKTFNYTGDDLTSIVLSGSTPNGIHLTKTLSYIGGSLSSISYS